MEKGSVQLDKNSQVRKARRVKFLFIWILLILAIGAGIIGFFNRKEFQIQSIQVVGTKSLDSTAIQAAVQHSISGSYGLIIPRTNALLFSKQRTEHTLMQLFPALSHVAINFTDRNNIVITIDEKKPQFVWCSDPTTCYFVDNNGMIYDSAPIFTPGVFITLTGGEIADPVHPLRSFFLPTYKFNVFKNKLESLEEYPLNILEVHYDKDITFTIDSIKGTLVNPQTQIITTEGAISADITSALDLLLRDKTFAATLATQENLLEYIDLRFPGKIYYKFNLLVPQTIVGDSSTAPLAGNTSTTPTAVIKKKQTTH